MKQFEYIKANNAKEAISYLSDDFHKTKILAGGMDLLGEMKEHTLEPDRVISITDIQELKYIKSGSASLRIGATTTLTEIAEHKEVLAKHAALAEAAASVGSVQIRNAGTLGGNLCQRPRCWYFRGEFYDCLKKGGPMCYAVSGRNKYHAIIGGSPCHIVHPSDCAPALIALGAKVKIAGPNETKQINLEDFFTLPDQNISRENILQANEIITEVEIPSHNLKSTYAKFYEKDGFDWAISAVAVALELDGKRCRKAHIVLGGVAPKPWRAKSAEQVIEGKTIHEELAKEAAQAAVEDAEPMDDNAYKVALTQTMVKDTLLKLVS